MDINRARYNLRYALGEELGMEYYEILKQWSAYRNAISLEEFDERVRKILYTEDQIRAHNFYLLEMAPKNSTHSRERSRTTSEKNSFENPEFYDYVQPESPNGENTSKFQNELAASELFMPDASFISKKIETISWKYGMEGAEKEVPELMVNACQILVKNLITAMISRKKGYKIRDKKFQYGFNQTVADPFLRNYNNIIDDTQESKVDLPENEDTFVPKARTCLEKVEQQNMFNYACSKRHKGDDTLNVKLLIDTIKENPKILGAHCLTSPTFLKLKLQYDY